MMYVVKHLIGVLAMPLAVAFLLIVIGVLCRARQRRRIAVSSWVAAVIVAYLGSSQVVGDLLLRPLEGRYPPLRDPLPQVTYVVVLGSGYVPRDHIPITGALDDDGLVRGVEGVRLMRRLTTAHLVVSGGAPPGHFAPALGYAELARDLGEPDSSLVLSSRPLDTGSEAHAIKGLLGDAPFLLVTSAYHMPRAMWLMQRVGAHAIAAPTGQRVGSSVGPSLLPSAAGLYKTERALHEYLGLAALEFGIE
jgi:uncharacterized SAM-binding protein YcdF (DUF218 family)